MNTTMDKPTNTMNNQMTEEDMNTLLAVFDAIQRDRFSAPNHLKALGYLAKKYGRGGLNACIDQLHAERKATK